MLFSLKKLKDMGNLSGKMRIKYYLVSEEGTVASWLVVYELPNELFALLDSGERSLLEIFYMIETDRWPPTEEEKKASEKRFIEESPTSLIDLPETRELFTQEES